MDQIQNQTPAPAEAKLHFLDYWRVIRVRKAIIITVFLITAIIATAVTFILPESFASTTKIKVENDGADIQTYNTPAANTMQYDPYFIQTTFEIMQSQVVLSNVIVGMDLNKIWGKKFFNGETLKTTETMAILKGKIKLEPVRNTKVMAITVYSDDKKEAADIANAVAVAYREYRLSTRRQLTSGGLVALNDEFANEEQQILAVQDKVDQLRRDLKITDQAQATEPTPSMDSETLQALNRNRIEGKRLYAEAAVQLDQLKATDKVKLRDVLPTVVMDATLSGLVDRLHEAQQNIAKLKVDYAVESVTVVRVQSLIDELDRQIDDRVVGILAGLESKVNSSKASMDALTQEVEDAKNKDMTEAAKNQPYYEQKRKLVQMQELHKLLYSKIEQTKLDYTMPSTSIVQIIEPAEPGKAPVRPNKPVNIALGLIVGLIMGVGLAFFIEYLDTSVKTIDDVERTFQTPVLGVIPQNIGYLLDEGAESKHAEAYRVLRTNLLFSRKNEGANTIVMVSAGAGEGKSTTTINLATVFAQSGSRVLIVDSDLRRPTLHKLFKVANNLGLTNYLLKQNTIAEVIQTTPVPGLDFMASGRLPNSSMGILGSAQMKEMIKELRERYDFIFFDSPPILGVSDASILASEVDLVMQVVQYRRYPQPMTLRAKQMIEKVGGNLVGIILNNINMSQDEGYYYYSGYYHDYYYSRSDSEQDAEAKALPGTAGEAEPGIKQKY